MAETVVPEARGKAEAMSSFLSLGGTIGPDGRYTEGKLKGKTTGQAIQEFERLWSSVGGKIKDKYALRNAPENALAPSEMAGFQHGGGMNEPYHAGGANPVAVPKPVAAPLPIQDEPGISNRYQGPPRPGIQPHIEARSRAVPYQTVAPKGDSLADQEIAKRHQAVANTPTGAPVLTGSDADSAGGNLGVRVNRLTGLPFGWNPGDPLPEGADAGMQQRAADSLKRQQVASSQARLAGDFRSKPEPAPKADPVSDYEKARTAYHTGADKYNRSTAAKMDSIYSGASELDQAKIVGNSLKRAGALNRSQGVPISGFTPPQTRYRGPRTR